MGSTFVRYRDRGFDANDSILELWLALLVSEIDGLDRRPDWLIEVRDEWTLQATAGFDFGVMPGLDRFVTDDERRTLILDLAAHASQKLRDRGAAIPRAELNEMGLGGDGATFTRDVPTEDVLRTASDFTKLLQDALVPEQK